MNIRFGRFNREANSRAYRAHVIIDLETVYDSAFEARANEKYAKVF